VKNVIEVIGNDEVKKVCHECTICHRSEICGDHGCLGFKPIFCRKCLLDFIMTICDECKYLKIRRLCTEKPDRVVCLIGPENPKKVGSMLVYSRISDGRLLGWNLLRCPLGKDVKRGVKK